MSERLDSLTRGTDFTVERGSFVGLVRVTARRRGLQLRTASLDADTIVIQVVPR